MMDLVRNVSARVYPVGRLDYASEGLLLMTNDGDLTQKLTHASSHVTKTYLVKGCGYSDRRQSQAFAPGCRLATGKTETG